MLANCRGYNVPVWTSVLLCWDTACWESRCGGRGKENMEDPSLWFLALWAGQRWRTLERFSFTKSIWVLPTALLGVCCSALSLHWVNTAASGDCMPTPNYMAIHCVFLKVGKEKGSCAGSPFHIYFCFLWRYHDIWRSDNIHNLRETNPIVQINSILWQFLGPTGNPQPRQCWILLRSSFKLRCTQSFEMEVYTFCSNSGENCRLQGALKSIKQDVCLSAF